ncbi:hypothetical protein [Meiothermus sp. Pnk-1]|uniref:hypothetical protein n=1 Tax=Meiothermus sp. Pnk-1 TaxID=873128 RepID=UPI000D7BAA0C|nr:hypothetical protein [Meiothermus sp. Pnk-1]PZA06025.1 hypothetical protein DNA98_15295 [Meiothermus sp. Pnk-1]
MYRNRGLDDGQRLRALVASLPLPFRGTWERKGEGRRRGVEVHFGWTEVAVEGRRLSLVVSRVPVLGRRGSWWLFDPNP